MLRGNVLEVEVIFENGEQVVIDLPRSMRAQQFRASRSNGRQHDGKVGGALVGREGGVCEPCSLRRDMVVTNRLYVDPTSRGEWQ
jgi:hypothetical protein